MDRTSRINRLSPLIAIALAAAALAGAQTRTMEPGPTRSPHGPLKVPCASCHTSTSWKPIRAIPEFSHNRETRYPLRGMHENVQCGLCHTKAVFTQVGARCADCHADIHRRQFGARCEECHSVRGWQVGGQSIRQHSPRFPLLGAHAAVDCESCHRGAAVAQYTGLSTQCASCHINDYNRAAAVDHRSAGFPTTCETCHGMDGWRAVAFDHMRFTGFALVGAHARLDCASCHIGNRYKGTPADCFSCHSKDYTSASNPNHVTGGFPTTCQTCHTADTWAGARFDHNALTKFPLTGAHAALACTSCHVGGRFTGTPANCVSCHLSDFQTATNPNHVAAGFPQDCAQCHTTTNWTGATFNHSTTKFPLTGAHTNVLCAQCHVNNRFAGTPTDCSSCHLTDFNKTTNPNHAASGFPQTCDICHNTTAWQPASFDHSKTTFPLTGAHLQTSCTQCHANNRFAGTPAQCSACHLDAFKGTTNPNHTAAGFPQDCSLCHSTTNWQGAKFDHGTTKFPLTGAHVPLACAQCHSSGVFAGLATTCVSCHLANFNGTTNPNHASAGFPQQCEVCHNTAAWQPASFNHSNTKFPLTGAHVTVQCAQCHIGGVYAGTPTDCYACHKAQYQGTTNPNHVAAAFPTTCATCHNTTAWTGATFNHTQFPIYSGTHAGRWTTCADCHTNPTSYQVFSCITCHTHAQSAVDPRHRSVRNYVYNGTSCYSCHPSGRGG